MRRGCKAKAYVLRFCLMPCHHTSSSRISFVLWCRIISANPEELAVQGHYFHSFQIKNLKKKNKKVLTSQSQNDKGYLILMAVHSSSPAST